MNLKKHLALALSVVLSISIILLPTKAAGFADVPANAWYAGDVNDVQQYGILQGVGNNQFNPSGNMTLAEAVTMASRTYAKIHNETIPNTNDDPWYWGYVEYAATKGIRSSSEFGTRYDLPCNRLTMGILFSRVLPADSQQELNIIDTIPDVYNYPENKGIYFLYRIGVLTGSDDYGSYNPYSKVSRAEAAAILNRVINPSKRKSFVMKPLPSFVDTFNLVSWKEDGLEYGPWGTSYVLRENGVGEIYENGTVYNITYQTVGLKISVSGPEIDDVAGSIDGNVLTLTELNGRYTAQFARVGSKEEQTISARTEKEYRAWRPSSVYNSAIQACIDYYSDDPNLYDEPYGYFTYDINNDGVEELFVGLLDYPGIILAAYTMQGSHAKCFVMGDSPIIDDYAVEATLVFLTRGNYVTKAYIDYWGNITYTTYKLSSTDLVKVKASRTADDIIGKEFYPY